MSFNPSPNVATPFMAPQQSPPLSEAQQQVLAERAASGGTMTASEQRDIMSAQALLDARAMPSIILEGEMGTGKTHSLQTLLMDAHGGYDGPPVSGIERVIMLTLEPGFEDVLGHIPANRLGWHFIPVNEGSFDGLINMVKIIQTRKTEDIQAMGGINRHLYPQMDHILGSCNSLVDDRTGETLGPVFKFPQNWCLWFESISALSEVTKNAVIGDKPFMEMRDYQMVQTIAKKFMHHLVFSTRCLFVATAHLERETNELTGLSELMVSTVGRKLAPVLPRFFSDVIITDRIDPTGIVGTLTPEFTWATVKPGVRSKTRNLPWSTKLRPDFRPLLDNFRRRQARSKPPVVDTVAPAAPAQTA